MIVKQIWTANAYRNFNYLIACSETGEALAIDPLDYEKCLRVAKEEGWNITQILNTHEHRDHTGGNEAMVRKTRAKILAHKNASDKIADGARGLGAGGCRQSGQDGGARGAGYARPHDESRVLVVARDSPHL